MLSAKVHSCQGKTRCAVGMEILNFNQHVEIYSSWEQTRCGIDCRQVVRQAVSPSCIRGVCLARIEDKSLRRRRMLLTTGRLAGEATTPPPPLREGPTDDETVDGKTLEEFWNWGQLKKWTRTEFVASRNHTASEPY